jgi:hypothetical protein
MARGAGLRADCGGRERGSRSSRGGFKMGPLVVRFGPLKGAKQKRKGGVAFFPQA